ncbi:Aminoglycoside phosphotransferase domain protein [Candidatus Magnetobacterium bavaricum]|uniref:Aminoglycoside phosphotransferase domain protein n=1 Tax=Candidatus Magnetobacterium bavaricum TaxID=29290 RepID=A0A0F3GUH0_9BACT|nr:Aminoglycoside phosphotransferase domain protein [Candidatus Magnetobacterium bavaricum]
MITKNEKRILVIENDKGWFEYFKRIIAEHFGEKRDIQIFGLKDIKDSATDKNFFDNVSYCLVDLELGPAYDKGCNDTDGLDIVLPKIREIAPWIPTACISILLRGNTSILIERLSVSDFDGLYPKQFIIHPENKKIHPDFNIDAWNGFLRNLSIKRVAAMTGRSTVEINDLLKKADEIDLTMSDKIKNLVNGIEDELFKEGIALLGLDGSVLSIDEMEGGFSDINVSIVKVYGVDNKNMKTHSRWIMKWGRDISKIANEIEAHKLMLRKGINRSLQVPLLHHNVVVWKGIGYIAYVFEDNAKTALELINDKGLKQLTKHIKKVANSLYSNMNIYTFSPREELKKWTGFDESRIDIIASDLLSKTFELSAALIHGDLHLRNILIKDNMPTLIDFARSDYGPIAVDIAKLTVDILVFYDKSELDKISFLDWEALIKTSLSGILKVYESYLKEKDDRKFFDLALKAYALKYTTYDDVSKERKAILEKLVRNQR